MSTAKIFYTRHDGGLTLIKNGKQSTVSSAHPNFDKILAALKIQDFEQVETLMSIEKTINKTGVSSAHPDCKVFVRDGSVYFTNTRNRTEEKLVGPLVDRILRDLGKPGCEKYAESLMMLMSNIQHNKLKDVKEELYQWFASGKNPITTDGCILAYKKVRADFLDIYTGKMDNAPGKIVRMKQTDVDPDRRNECSRGLHFASLGYLSHYGSCNDYKVVIVKVNPRHIFAIPRDYNCQKGRASEYFVVGEYTGDNRQDKEAYTDSFIDDDNMQSAAPQVKYTEQGLRPSLETRAESYGLVKGGKVQVRSNDNGERIIVSWDGEQDDKTVTNYPNYTVMSFETKSVREAVKAAVEQIEK